MTARFVAKRVKIAAACLAGGLPDLLLARRAIRREYALQRTWELMSLLRLVRRRRPRGVVEIGTCHGGTLFCWGQVAAPDALLVSIDLPGAAFGVGYTPHDIPRFQRFLRPGQRLECILDDSRAPATVSRVREILASAARQIDFLFIDGDHTYAGVRGDFELYAPMLAPDAVVAFHDINPDWQMPESEVHRFWAEISRRESGVIEFVDEDGAGNNGFGIGVLFGAALR